METLEQLQAIIDFAPSGTTEVGKLYGEFIYIDNRDNGHQFKIWFGCHNKWVFSELVDGWQYIRGIRLLSDIKRIIELEKKLAEIRFNLNHGVKCSNIPNDLAM